MRLLRLELLRYGPFTDKILTLKPGARLHLVYGPNEAGKSSSLAAIGDLLFGFPKRREYDFLHDAQTLRVGAEIRSRSGESLTFRRRRGTRNTLLSNDESEAALQEDALAPFVGGLSREVFSRAFGLNSESLRLGGEAMLESEGEMGAALFAAASGLTSLARIRRNLDAEADAIFAPRPSRERRFYQALERYETAITAERHNELKSGDWKALVADITEIERQLAEIRVQRTDVTTALARLRRLRVLAPTLVGIDQITAELRLYDDLPEVPEGFLEECTAALEAAEVAGGQARAAIEEVAGAVAALRSIEVDDEVAAQAARIVELFSQKGDYISKLAECPRLEAERDELTATLADQARQLGFDDLDEMVRYLPPAAVLVSAREVIDAGLVLEAEISTEEKRLREEMAVLRMHEAETAGVSIIDPKPWRDQMAALGPDLKELSEQSYLETSYRNMLQKLTDASMRLVPRVTNIEELAIAMLPSREIVAGHKAVFDKILSDRREEMIRLETNMRQRGDLEQKLLETEQVGPISYLETIRLVRADRDGSYETLRNHLMRNGRLLTPAEIAEWVVRFEEESAEADSLADQAIADADRISRLASYRDQLEELERQHPAIEARLDELAAQQTEALQEYAALFAPAGVAPMGPEAMIGWLVSIEDLLVMRRDVDALAAQIASLEVLGQQIHGALVGIGRHVGIEAVDALPPLALARLINAALEEMTGRWASRLTFEGARKATRLRAGQIEDALGRTRRRHAEWRERFLGLLPALGLDDSTTTAGAAAALAVWAAVPDVSRERTSRAARVAGMQRDLAAFEEGVLELAQDLAPMLVDLPAEGLIDVLREQAETARAAKARQDDARIRLELAEKRLATARAAQEDSAAALNALASMLPEGTNARSELQRLDRRGALRAQMAARHHDFEAHAEGRTEASIRLEMSGFESDRSALDAEDLERRSDTLHVENNRLYAMLGQKQGQRDAFEGGIGSEFAAFERQSAEAEIVATARQWAVRKIAAIMLGAAIERHREAQSDPLMLRAGSLFKTLTGDSFSGLMQDYGDDDQPRLVGVRKRGERVAIGGMSEGTRDQLYLALRLAYLEDYAGRTEPVPFIGDDIFQTFDDERTSSGIQALASSAGLFQPILFTHHLSVVAIAKRALGNELDYVEL